MPDLKPWRDVVRPHPDVAEGRYQEAEFAADLAEVLRETAEPEYQDPVEFYQRTFITHGIDRLLTAALERVGGSGGEPIVKLETTFGGGKTHTLLALYHLFSGRSADELKDIPEIVQNVGLHSIPEANIAVLAGTALDPTQPKEHPDLNGGRVRTLWGEMAAQLGGEEAYERVRQADERGAAPGSDTLVDLFDDLGPAVILIDELVAYARNIYGQDDSLPAGTFDSVMTFVQNLTEAVKRSDHGMVVASIPESEMEIGEEGEGGWEALRRIEHTFGRLEATWTPVQANEGFHIVRRRLFANIEDEDAREKVCQAFHKMYKENEGEVPTEAKRPEYLEDLRKQYPIHPEVFERLYEGWAAMDRFQRTRGVLRLMAAAIHELWQEGDEGLMIMPADIRLDKGSVRSNLMNYLDEPWNSVVDTDIDGDNSTAVKVDNDTYRLGQHNAGRRVARTIFLGTAPQVKEQNVRGMEKVRVRLGCVQPEEPIAVYNDAIGRLADRCMFLYSGNQRFWFDTRPTLSKQAQDIADGIEDPDARIELEDRLKGITKRGEFEGIHTCPSSPGDVQDTDEARLVILGPEHVHRDGNDKPAQDYAEEILESRGSTPRTHRNMLIFLAPDERKIGDCVLEIKKHQAWQQIYDERKELNLDAHQMEEAENEAERTDKSVDLKIRETYCWLFVPHQTDATGDIKWESKRLQGTHEGIINRASKAVVSAEQMIVRWSPALLKRELGHEKWDPWDGEDHISTSQLWEFLTQYLYLPRLKNRDVLETAIQKGIESGEYFGYATSVSEDRYQGLKFGHSGETVYFDDEAVLVKPDAAKQQLQHEREQEPDIDGPEIVEGSGETFGDSQAGSQSSFTTSPGAGASAEETKRRRFYGQRTLEDPESLTSDIGQIVQEVVRRLVADDADVEISIEVRAETEDGFSDDTVHTVEENTNTLKFDQAEFVEE